MRIAVLSPVPTHPPIAGNRARILALARLLESRGHEVHFVYVTYEPADLAAMEGHFGARWHLLRSPGPPALTRFWPRAWRKVARRLGVVRADCWRVDEWYDERIGPALQAICEAHGIETVLCEYVFLSRALTALPPTVRSAIDCHDLFADRHLMYRREGMRPAWFSTTREEEIAALRRAGAVIAISDEEAAILRERGLPEVVTVGPVFPLPESLPDPGRPTLLFVGSANAINLVALAAFLARTWPCIRAAQPDAELLVGGECGRSLAPTEGVRSLGALPEIASAYRAGAVAINPVEVGTGFCVKTMEALAFGRPLVTTASGARGLKVAETPFLRIADSPEDFARACLTLLADRASRSELGRQGREFVERWTARQAEALDQALGIAPAAALRC